MGFCVAEGARASVGDALVEIAGEHDGSAPGPRAMPRVRALAADLGVDLAALRPGGGTVTRGGGCRAAAEAGAHQEQGKAGERVPLRGFVERSPST